MSATNTAKERSIRGTKGSGNKYVKIRSGSFNLIEVEWMGEVTRVFNGDEIKEAITLVNTVGTTKHGPVWLNMKDGRDRPYWILLEADGTITLNDAMTENGWVKWTEFQEKLAQLFNDLGIEGFDASAATPAAAPEPEPTPPVPDGLTGSTTEPEPAAEPEPETPQAKRRAARKTTRPSARSRARKT